MSAFTIFSAFVFITLSAGLVFLCLAFWGVLIAASVWGYGEVRSWLKGGR